MSNKIKALAVVALVGLSSFSTASAQREVPELDILTGDTKLACEAVLCLSTSTRPSECTASLRKFFSISHRKPWKIPELRFNFLELCPIASDAPATSHSPKPWEMRNYMKVIAEGATRCSANHLNISHWRWVTVREPCGTYEGDKYYCDVQKKQIINTLPQVCQVYLNHHFTDGRMLETLKYTVHYEQSGYKFGSWSDQFIHIDSSNKAEEDNSKGD